MMGEKKAMAFGGRVYGWGEICCPSSEKAGLSDWWTVTADLAEPQGLNRLRKNSAPSRNGVPLKPDVFSIVYSTTKVVP